MRLYEISFSNIKRYMNLNRGSSWSKVGDVVKGSAVFDYLENSSYYVSSKTEEYIKSHDFKLIELSPDQAKKFRQFTDPQNTFIDKADKYPQLSDLSYTSLLQNPPVVSKTGRIIDGNHRVERAIELEFGKIPVLMAI